MQRFRALGAPPPDPRAFSGWRLRPSGIAVAKLTVIKYWRFWQMFVKLYVTTKKLILIDLSKTVDSWSTGVGTSKNIGSLKACNAIC